MQRQTAKNVTVGVLALAACGAVFVAAAQSPRAANQAFMREKLTWAQGVLEGLSLERYELVTKNAIRMRQMTQTNAWTIMSTPEFKAQTAKYQKSIDALYSAGVDKNLEAATEAYANVAKSCVECHRVLRAEQRRNQFRNP